MSLPRTREPSVVARTSLGPCFRRDDVVNVAAADAGAQRRWPERDWSLLSQGRRRHLPLPDERRRLLGVRRAVDADRLAGIEERKDRRWARDDAEADRRARTRDRVAQLGTYRRLGERALDPDRPA